MIGKRKKKFYRASPNYHFDLSNTKRHVGDVFNAQRIKCTETEGNKASSTESWKLNFKSSKS